MLIFDIYPFNIRTLLQWERGGWHKVPPEPILEKLLATYLVFIKVGRLFDPFTVGERGLAPGTTI